MIELLIIVYLVYVLKEFFGIGKDGAETYFRYMLYSAVAATIVIVVKLTTLAPF